MHNGSVRIHKYTYTIVLFATLNQHPFQYGPLVSCVSNFRFPLLDILYRIKNEILLNGEILSTDSRSDDNTNNAQIIRQQQRDRLVLASLLPKTAYEIERAYRLGTDKYRLLPSPTKPSFCLDHITIQKSTIEHAGMGAFATKTFPIGSVVAVTPLLVIPDKINAMSIQNGNTNNTIQLLENYCFGHKYATNLLLCPTTHAALINHSRRTKKTQQKKKANVRLSWAQDLNVPCVSNNHPLLLDMADLWTTNLSSGVLDVDQYTLSSFPATKLAFEYVAIQDIQVGDEILLDYGDQYEQALQQHKERNNNNKDKEKKEGRAVVVTPPSILNTERRPIVLSTDPFMSTGGHYTYECKVFPNLSILLSLNENSWEDFWASRMMDSTNWPDEVTAMYGNNDYASWYPCRVLYINEEENVDDDGIATGVTYDVEIYTKGNMKSGGILRYLANCPRDRIRFAWAAYQSSQHRPMAFRHYLPIPDDIFPHRWRDDYKPRESWKLGRIGESSIDVDYEATVRNATCGLYLAESNIPNGGFGLYTGVDIPASGLVVGSTHAALSRHAKDVPGRKQYRWPGKDYVWAPSSFSVDDDGAPEYDIEIICGLFGSLANFHTGLVNMYMKTDTIRPKLDRRVDPGAGAFSDIPDSGFISAHPVAAGEELFVR
jgi:hypothetical protein